MSSPPFSEQALRRIAEEKILAAYEAGEFERLPGFGKPLPLIDEHYDPGWWVRRKLKWEELGVRLTPG